MQDLTPSEVEAILKSIGHTMPEHAASTFETSSGISPPPHSHSEEIAHLQLTQLQEKKPSELVPVNQQDLMNTRLQLDVILGRTKISLKDLLSLKAGQVFPLDQLAGERVDIEINGQQIGKGEVVVVDEYFGVHITELFRHT
jgi:flagellar motor switch protein FliN